MVSESDVRKLVVERIRTMPANVRLSLGGSEDLDKDALISHVERGDELGEKIVEMHMNYLRSLRGRYCQAE